MREFIAGTTVSPRFDLRVGETNLEVSTILDLIQMYDVTTFIEVGVHEGGLTEHILTHFPGINYVGIEIDEVLVNHNIKSLVTSLGSRVIYGDCMAKSTLDLVRSYMSGKTLIYCDNGNKKVEITLYCKLLNIGDILLTHDYMDGIRVPKDVNLDYNREVTPEDILFLDINPNFMRLPEEQFKETRLVGWVTI